MAQSFVVYITIADIKNDKSTLEIPIPNTTALSDLPEVVEKFAGFVDNLITGVIVNAGVRVEPDSSGWGLNDTPAATSDVQERGRFVFRTENLNLKSVSVGTFDETLMLAGSPYIDTASDNAAKAFVDMMIDGAELDDEITWVEPCDYRGEDLETLVEAVEAWGKSRK
jgi:hypothetical protein